MKFLWFRCFLSCCLGFVGFVCLFVCLFSCNLRKVQHNQLGGDQDLKSKTKIRLSEEDNCLCVIVEIFPCSPETAGLLSNLKSTQSALYELVQSKCKIHKEVTQEKWYINSVANISSGICGVI